MSTTFEPSGAKPRSRSRLALVLFAAVTLATNVYFLVTARTAAQAMEARALAGNFPAMQLATGPTEITDDGRVYAAGAAEPTGYVASTHLVPGGKYLAVILADDGNEAHKAKAMLVIGAQDAKAQWHPASAAAIAKRLATPKH
jgi:hypothetical protein